MKDLKINPLKPILIAGPTASGKSALAMELAQGYAAEYNPIIINADALQVYDCWRVLTARPSRADEARVKHRLYGQVAHDQSYSVGHWLRDLLPYLDVNRTNLPIIVGGTGLYFTALTEGLADIPDIPAEIRQAADKRFAVSGLVGLIADLQQHDPKVLTKIDPQNPVRVQRAWEVWRATGRSITDWQADTPPPMLPLSDCNAFVLNAPKDWLTPRINGRFQKMLAAGALEECRENLTLFNAIRPASRAIGAPELVAYLKGEITIDEAIVAAETATRRYAKRQRSWFRARMQDWTSLSLSTDGLGISRWSPNE